MQEVVPHMQQVVPIVSPLHRHPLIPFTRFDRSLCEGCYPFTDYVNREVSQRKPGSTYIYGGYRCNEPGCEFAVFHKECANPLPEINHSFHPDHLLKLITILDRKAPHCSFCKRDFKVGYSCSICDFKLEFVCAARRDPFVIPGNSYVHEHPLHLSYVDFGYCGICEACNYEIGNKYYYRCQECQFVIHVDCVDFGREAYHTSHPRHPLKFLRCEDLSNDESEDLFSEESTEELSNEESTEELFNEESTEGLFNEENEDLIGEESTEELFNYGSERSSNEEIEIFSNEESERLSNEESERLSNKESEEHVDRNINGLSRCSDFQRTDLTWDADEKCLLCGMEVGHQLHHCDVCNFSICRACMKNPPPIRVESLRTHEHQLHLVPRLINFTCDGCGTQGDRSPYFCLPCNFMIHRQCIGLPRVININRHDHRISYTPRLGNGEWKCKVCRSKVDGFYGAYTCSKCPSFAVHARCATRKDVWDMIELEGIPEEEIIAPFEVIDENTIKHFTHDHNLKINSDGMILPESILCDACVFQICSEPFYYRCKECDFILHKKCANLPRKKRHVSCNQPFTLRIDCRLDFCSLCDKFFTGFRYEAGTDVTLDVRCASISDSLEHESHPHPLYYYSTLKNRNYCRRCRKKSGIVFRCDECDYILDPRCAVLPKKVTRNRYDDHPLFLSYGDMNVDEKYWCEACETKVNPKQGFYTCNDCGVVLHVSCVVEDFSYIMPGSLVVFDLFHLKPRAVARDIPSLGNYLPGEVGEVVLNSSICRLVCSVCKYRCKFPCVLKVSKDGVDIYICSLDCRALFEPVSTGLSWLF